MKRVGRQIAIDVGLQPLGGVDRSAIDAHASFKHAELKLKLPFVLGAGGELHAALHIADFRLVGGQVLLRFGQSPLVPRLQRLAVQRGFDDWKERRNIGAPQSGHAQRT